MFCRKNFSEYRFGRHLENFSKSLYPENVFQANIALILHMFESDNDMHLYFKTHS